ncbi:MAG: TRAP transporter small permease [Burkholderiales bacterium]|nr:TRAP transporter small permease [Burkholderiales bacterium]
MAAYSEPPRAVTRALDLLIGRLCLWVAVMVLAAAFAVVCAQVFARYVLNDSLIWAEELTRFLVVWSTMIGSAAAYRRGEHIGITMVLDKLAGAWRGTVVRAIHLLVLAFASMVAWEGWHLTMRNFARNQLAPAMQVDIAWAYLALPIGGFLIALAAAEALWRGAAPTKEP